MRVILAGLILFSLAGRASAQDRVIGLLALPEVYGARMCAPFEPGQVALHPTPKTGAPIAFIRVDQGRAENGPPDIVGTGWMPLHAADGEPTLWFSSRGC